MICSFQSNAFMTQTFIIQFHSTGYILLTTNEVFINYNYNDGSNHKIRFENDNYYLINEINNFLNNESLFEVSFKCRKLVINST